MEDFTNIVSAVRDLGVPVVMLGWFMWRFEKKLESIEKALIQVSVALALDEQR